MNLDLSRLHGVPSQPCSMRSLKIGLNYFYLLVVGAVRFIDTWFLQCQHMPNLNWPKVAQCIFSLSFLLLVRQKLANERNLWPRNRSCKISFLNQLFVAASHFIVYYQAWYNMKAVQTIRNCSVHIHQDTKTLKVTHCLERLKKSSRKNYQSKTRSQTTRNFKRKCYKRHCCNSHNLTMRTFI